MSLIFQFSGINVTSFSILHTEATVSIDLKNVLRMVTSILWNHLLIMHFILFHSFTKPKSKGFYSAKNMFKLCVFYFQPLSYVNRTLRLTI